MENKRIHNLLIKLTLVSALVGCTNTSKNITQLEPPVSDVSTPTIDDTTLYPPLDVQSIELPRGEVSLLKFPFKETDAKNRTLICDDRPVKYFYQKPHIIAFLSANYFEKVREYDCFFSEHNIETLVANVQITKKRYPFERLNVDKKRVHYSKKDLARIIKEKKKLQKVYKSSSKDPLFSESFAMPLNSKITSTYGARRIFNNSKKTQHLGTDFRAKVGKPIAVTNSGRVVLAQDLFFTGNTIIIDHGMEIFSIYGHLSEIDVNEGDFVPKLMVIGKAGKTGRVTGPHLHWGVKIANNSVDGISLVQATR